MMQVKEACGTSPALLVAIVRVHARDTGREYWRP